MFQTATGRVIVLLALVGLIAAGCTGGASPTPAEAPTEAPDGESPGAGGESPTATAGGTAQLPEPELTDITMGLSVTETSQFASQLAVMSGIYEKYGLNVEPSTFEGDGLVVQALVAEQLDVGMIGVSAAVNSRLTETPLKVVSVNAVILTDQLVAAPDVTNADQLRGKQVAVSTFGGTSHGAVLLSLDGLGLTPEDVVITQIGGQSARIAALEGGAVAAAPIDASLEQQMLDQGFNILIDLKEERLPWGRSGMAFRDDFLEENPNTALLLVAGALEAQNMMWEDPETAAEFYAEFTQLDPEEALRRVEEFQEIGNRTMRWEPAAFENPQRVLATVTPAVADVTTSDAYTLDLLAELEEIGFYEQHGIPLDE